MAEPSRGDLYKRQNALFRSIHEGLTTAQVLSILGEPHKVIDPAALSSDPVFCDCHGGLGQPWYAELDLLWQFQDPYRARRLICGFRSGVVAHVTLETG